MQYTGLCPATGSAVVPPDPVKNDFPALERAITQRSSSPSNRPQSRYQRQRSLSEGRIEMITPEEYAALPPSIQKKYFSSTERLRIAQETAAGGRKKQRRKQTWLSSTSSADISCRPQSARELRQSPSPLEDTSRNELRSTDDPVNEDQAAWFLRLPEKVQRQQFSKEEQALLTGESHKALREAATRPAARPFSGRPLLAHDHNAPQVRPSNSTDRAADVRKESDCRPSNAPSQKSCGTADTEMGIFKLYFRKHGHTASGTAYIPPPAKDPSPAPPPSQSSTAAKIKHKSIQRAFSLTPLALPPPTLAPLPSIPSSSPVRTAVASARLSRRYTGLVLLPSEPAPSPTYYRDPEARKQLREYLGARHRFDEAIEFGFPSPEPMPPASAGTDRSSPMQRASSDFGDDRDDSSLQSDGPSTPTGVPAHHEHKVAQLASFDSDVVLPLQLNASSSNISNREMTLRLTLTRPELQISEDQLYSWQRTQTSGVAVADSDPLALEPLSISEDPTGAHGAFAGQHCGRSKGLGRVWKSIRRH